MLLDDQNGGVGYLQVVEGLPRSLTRVAACWFCLAYFLKEIMCMAEVCISSKMKINKCVFCCVFIFDWVVWLECFGCECCKLCCGWCLLL